MKKVFIINGGQKFGHSQGQFNETITQWTTDFFKRKGDTEVKITNINKAYDPDEEVRKYVWADVIIYHTPIWWFQLPFKLKEYIDVVFSAGHAKGLYESDGRSRKNPAVNYGKGGSLHGRSYMLTTSWNAPEEAFILPGEFFSQRNVDEGVMFGFHRMNAFLGLDRLEGFHFHDMEKGVTIERIHEYQVRYIEHLAGLFSDK